MVPSCPTCPAVSAEESLRLYLETMFQVLPTDVADTLKMRFKESESQHFHVGTLCSGSDSVLDAMQAFGSHDVVVRQYLMLWCLWFPLKSVRKPCKPSIAPSPVLITNKHVFAWLARYQNHFSISIPFPFGDPCLQRFMPLGYDVSSCFIQTRTAQS